MVSSFRPEQNISRQHPVPQDIQSMSTENPELCAAGLRPPQSSCGLLPGNTPSKPNLELTFFVDILLLQNNLLWLVLSFFSGGWSLCYCDGSILSEQMKAVELFIKITEKYNTCVKLDV